MDCASANMPREIKAVWVRTLRSLPTPTAALAEEVCLACRSKTCPSTDSSSRLAQRQCLLWVESGHWVTYKKVRIGATPFRLPAWAKGSIDTR